MNLLQFHAKRSLLVGFLFFLSYTSVKAQNGQQIFREKCASCHGLDRAGSGPALRGVLERGPWAEDRANIYKWVANPAAFIKTNEYTQALQKQYGSIMPGFAGQLTEKDIDAIFEYIATAPAPGAGTDKQGGGGGSAADSEAENNRGAVIFGVISLILAIVALILMQVNSNLKKLSDDSEKILRPDPVPFWRNKIYIALFAIVFFIVGGYFVGKGAIGLGRQQGYAPEQPIYYSHKVHAGINQINCLYCHNSAWDSKHAGIPSLNICMNCHVAVQAYEKGPKLMDEEGNEIDGTAEIQKLFRYAGYTPGPGAKWDPSKAKSPEWVKIHNLPDHVYFNHAQHTRVGGVACQTCHGNIQEMDVVSQTAELSMGWCINCHRESKVNFNYTDSTGNQFYSIYEKFHNDLKPDTIWIDKSRKIWKEIRPAKMDSITVKDIGGLECQKCHY
ncbi:MAG TPA: c-type cytochrome [Flavisolibacter sp.]|nr:c-type cytochrome [Flavisolibacter sp.]